ncbi:MAG: HAD-IA family hydrolase [Propionibacteriaceae bacterium]|nr:HAD-IA family hydrolase [Propionibacteriaceae bacterium]
MSNNPTAPVNTASVPTSHVLSGDEGLAQGQSPTWPVVLFDLDGTLANSIELIIDSYQYAFRAVSGREVTRAEALSWIGQTLPTTFTREDPAGAAELERIYREYNHEHMAEIVGYPGVPDLLRSLAAAGAAVGVVTSKRRTSMDITMELAGVTGLAEPLVALEDTARHKPNPDPLFEAMKRLNVQPDKVVYVGDAVWDVLSAQAAGVSAIAVTWGAGVPTDLRAVHPDAICTTIAELRAALLR